MRQGLARFFSALDRWALDSLGEKYNPFSRLGALAVTNLIIAIVSGVLLLPFYSVSIHGAYNSVQEMLGSGWWYAGVIHSVHRYSSDAAVFFALLHLFRVISIRGYDRPRGVSWFTGVLALGVIWLIGWLGYWLVWDQAGFLVAEFSGRLLDSLPIFGTPISRALLLDSSVNNQIFFVVFFVHMLLPLALFILLWVHIYRVNRPQFMVARRYVGYLILSLIIVAAIFPAHSDVKASQLLLKHEVSGDYLYLFALRAFYGMSTWGVWSALAGSFIFVSLYPWLFMKKNHEPSKVESAKCIACMQCINDCPHGAIDLVPREDGKPFDGVALVNPGKCVSCGVCNGACDSFANNLPFLPTKKIQSLIEAWAAESIGRAYLLFVCRDLVDRYWQLNQDVGQVKQLPDFRVIEVPCVGHVNPHMVKLALMKGFKGVMITASLQGSCPYRDGDEIAEQRFKGERKPTGLLRPENREKILFARFDRNNPGAILKRALLFAGGIK